MKNVCYNGDINKKITYFVGGRTMLLEKLLCDVNYKKIINKSSLSLSDIEINKVCYNSTNAKAGSVFVCVTGALNDGHKYANDAYERGCRVFICQDELDLPDDVVVIITENSRIALATVSANFFSRPAEKLTIIGITGTKGKTTTSLLIYNVLNANGIKAGYIGSNGVDFDGSHFATVNTTPESHDIQDYMSRMVCAGVKALVMEVSSQALLLSRVHGIKFNICVFTNLYPDHIGKYEHPDFDNYKACKHSLFTDYGASFVVYNADDPHASEVIAGCGCPSKGISVRTAADYSASDIEYLRPDGNIETSFTCHVDGIADGSFPVSLSFPGEFSVYNALTSIAVCRRLGIEYKDIVSALAVARIKGRFETIACPNGAMVVIDYAHNGVSLEAALTALRKYNPTRLICLFGSVGERTQMRRGELGLVASRGADLCIITSDNPDNEPPMNIIGEITTYFTADSCPYHAIPDRKEAIEFALKNSEKGDIILLAGKGHETYQLVKGKREYFSEAEIVYEAFDKIGVK